jgi:long-subunit fatty acid transport protein
VVQLRHLFVCLTALLAVGGQVAAQEESISTLEFSFSNPGARSMGVGGAFVALADDATAAIANPAGLLQLVRSEVSIEGRYWGYTTPNVEGGRIFGPPTGEGLDVSPGLRVGESSEELSGLSFLSLVHSARRWSLAFYRHQLANYEFYGETGALFAGPWPGFPDSRARSWDLRKAVDLDIVSYGVSGAYRVTERLSLGLGVTYFEGSMKISSETFAAYAADDPTDFEFYHAESLFAPELLVERLTNISDDTDFGVLAGILLRLSERWSLGAVVREGPELEALSEVRAGPVHDSHSEGDLLQSGEGEIWFPDVYGVGIAFRSRDDRVTIGFEWDRITYSDLRESTGADPEFVLDDGNEWRLGGEYAFLGSRPILALRLGAWLDPVHRIGYRGGDYVAQAVLDPGSDELHLAGGIGFAFQRFQIDLGVDISDLADTASISAIYSF